MNTIEEILEAIRNIADDDLLAREKLMLFWKKLFLLEKDMTKFDKIRLFFKIDSELMNKRVYNWNLENCENDSRECFLASIIREVYEEMCDRGFISYTYLNPCINLCEVGALILYRKFMELGFSAKILHTKKLNISFVPHFFTIVTLNNRSYIIDPTFRQFLTVVHFIPEVIYHFKDNFLSPAYFGNDSFFIKLGIDGFFEATEENIRIYFEGFIKASESTKLQDSLSVDLIRERKIKINDYIDKLEIECKKFDIEQYASCLV